MSLFKAFKAEGRNAGQTQLKASVQRSIKCKMVPIYLQLKRNSYASVTHSSNSGTVSLAARIRALEQIFPKKQDLTVVKLPEHVQLLMLNGIPLFFSTRDGGWFPTLRLLHKYPLMMPRLRVDQGAIKFVLSGANIMCPGLTSPGATIHDEVAAGTPVAIYAETTETAVAVGITTLSTEEIKTVNKGIGVDNLHCLNDGLWKTQTY